MSGPTTAFLITARMTSSRLAGKPIVDVCGQAALALMLRRLVGAVDYLVVAVPDDGTSEPIARVIPPGTATIYYGDPEDLLSRLAGAARHARADVVAIAGADCPLLDPYTLLSGVKAVLAFPHPMPNVQTRGWPQGMNVQAMTAAALYDVEKRATERDDRLYYNAYFDRHPERYPLVTVTRPGADEYPHRVTLDTEADLALIRRLVEDFGPDVSAEQIIKWLHEHPDADMTTRGIWNYHPDTAPRAEASGPESYPYRPGLMVEWPPR